MPDFLLLMHDDGPGAPNQADWRSYIAYLQSTGHFQGGSAIGGGICARKAGPAPAITPGLSGFIRIGADSLEHAMTFLRGNPLYEAGGTVEIRTLPETG